MATQPNANAVSPFNIITGRSGRDGSPAQQLAAMRQYLQMYSPPQYQAQPVNDLGGGIMVAANSIASAIQNRRQMQMQAQMYSQMVEQQQAAEQQETDNAIMVADHFNISPADYLAATDGVRAKLIDESLAAKDAEAKAATQQKYWNDAYVHALNKLGADPTNSKIPLDVEYSARVFANNAVGSNASPLDQGAIQDAQKRKTLTGELQGLVGTAPDNVALTPAQQNITKGVYGFVPYDAVTEQQRRANSNLAATNAQYQPSLKATELQGNQLKNTGQQITNDLKNIDLQKGQVLWQASQAALNDPTREAAKNLPFVYTSINPGALPSFIEKPALGKTLQDAYPDISIPNTAGQQPPGQSLMFDTNAFLNNVTTSPVDRLRAQQPVDTTGFKSMPDTSDTAFIRPPSLQYLDQTFNRQQDPFYLLRLQQQNPYQPAWGMR